MYVAKSHILIKLCKMVLFIPQPGKIFYQVSNEVLNIRGGSRI